MKILVVFFVAVFLFLFVFVSSNTLERRVFVENKGGDEYFVTKTSIRWDRFTNYIKGIPGKAINGLYSLKSKIGF